MIRFRIVLNVLIVTSVIGLAISYLTTLLPQAFPHLNFLEAVGVYCIWTPVHHLLLSHSKNDIEE